MTGTGTGTGTQTQTQTWTTGVTTIALLVLRTGELKIVDFLMFVWHVRGTILKTNVPDTVKIYNRMHSLQIRTLK